jgi:hypothetical protein
MKIKEGEEEKSYFDPDFLVQRFLGMSPDQIKMNKKYKEKEEKAAKKEKPEEGKEGGEAVTL